MYHCGRGLESVPRLGAVYGQNDSYVEGPQRIKLYRTKPGAKRMWEVPGARHNQAVVTDPEGYQQRIADFLDRYLPARPAEEGRS